jgi:hypothetical protein
MEDSPQQDMPPAAVPGYHVLDDWVVYPVLVFGVVLAAVPSLLLGQQICLPLLPVLVIAPLFLWAVRLGRPQRAMGLALVWAASLAVTIFVASLAVPERAGQAIWHGLEIRSEVLAWIATGMAGAGEVLGLPLDLSTELQQALVVLAGSLASAGLVGLAVDALLINATSFVAASIVAQASSPVPAILVAWPIWNVIRLLGYIVCGAVLAEPVFLSRLLFGTAREPAPGSPASLTQWWHWRRRLLASGIGLILLASALQFALGPSWAAILRRATGLAG